MLKYLNGNQNNFEKKLNIILSQRRSIQTKSYLVKKIIQKVKKMVIKQLSNMKKNFQM